MPFPYTLPFIFPRADSEQATTAVDKLLTQFRGTSVERLIAGLASSSQRLQDGVATLRLRRLDVATGVQLDRLGAIVGQPRLGFLTDDEVYRTWIRARVLLNRCGGTATDLITILSTLVPSATIKYEPSYPAGFVLSVLGQVTADQATALLDIARAATSGGVNLLFVWNLSDPVDIFTLDGTPAQSLDAGHLAGASS